MIGRLWRGWAPPENADAYENLLRTKILPEIHGVEGYHGGYILRREHSDEVDFVVINLFDSVAAVRGFAGNDYETAVISSEAAELLSRFNDKAEHFDVRLTPEA